MGIVDFPIIDLIGKVRSWVGVISEVVPESVMSFVGDSGVCGCGERLGLSSYRYRCLSCGGLFCRKCTMSAGQSVCCKYCYRAAGENRDVVQQSVMTAEFDRCSSLSRCSSDRINRLGESQQNYSMQPVSSSTSRSFDDDEEEGCESSRQYFSTFSEFSQDTSDVDSICVSTSNEFCSFRSANSSPLESPSRRRQSQDSVSSLPPNNTLYHQGYPRSLPKNGVDLEELLENSNESMYHNFPVGDSEEIKEFIQHVDFENHELWHPPPADFEDDGGETGFFEYSDEDDDVGDSAKYFTSSSLFSDNDTYPAKETPGVAHKEVLKSAVHGHFKALVCQLLKGEGVYFGNENDGHGWLDVVCSLAWHAANYVKPDTSKGGSMDPGEYVKVKCIASGSPSDSILVKGVVCTKNLKHKRMMSQHKNPSVLLLGGALEYHKVPNKLASINTLLEQENDHMKMALDKIEALRPNVLLVEKTVSSYAQERLLAKKEISLVLNVKRSLLERIARCTGAQIAPSVDGVTSARLGHCEMFRIERVFEECSSLKHPRTRSSKTLMFFEGCPRRLGCTVLLRGTCLEELKKVKHVVQYAIFAAYHLSLETSFLADEGASLPKLPLGSPPTKVIEPASCISKHFGLSGHPTQDHGEVHREDLLYTKCDVEYLLCPDSLHLNQGTRILEACSKQQNHKYTPDNGNSGNFIGFSQPILQTRRENTLTSTTNMYLVQYVASGFQHDKATNSTNLPGYFFNKEGLLSQESVATRSKLSSGRFPGSDEQNRMHVGDSIESPREYFSPADNQQSILVSLSSTCITKGTVCEGSQLFRIKFYGSFDKPLGRYLRDDLFDRAFCCHSCRGPTDAHVRCYTHQQGSLSISVKRLLSKRLPGERDGKIWMWHRCLKCEPKNGVPPAACRVVMSDAAWGLSFGKFLELSFSNHATANRVASCGHSLQRDCLRFYGFGSMVAVFHYSPVDIFSVHLPSCLLDFTCQIQQEWLRQEAKMICNKIDILHERITGSLETIKLKITSWEDETLRESIIKKIMELKDLLYMEKNEYDVLLQPLTVENIQHFPSRIDILDLNRMRRTLLIDSYEWNRRLCLLDTFSKGKDSLLENDTQALDIPCKEGMFDSGHENFSGFPTSTSPSRMSSFLKQHDEFGVNIWECNTNNMIEMDLSIESAAGYVGRAGLNVISQNICTSDNKPPNTEAICTTFLDSSASSASSLSDKIDLAWTGTGQLMMNQSKVSPNSDSVRQVKFPLRVYSFDSALRIRKRVRGGYFPFSSYAAVVKSLDSSGGVSNMTRDSIPNMRRAYSHSSPRAIQNNRMPACILPTSFLVSDGARLMLPQTGLDDIVIAVFDNEPTSIVSYAMTSKEYIDYVTTTSDNISIQAGYVAGTEGFTSRQLVSYSQPENGLDYSRPLQGKISDPKEAHFRMAFDDDSFPGDKVKFSVTCYFAKQFDLLRKKCCPSELDYIRSLCRCKRWNAQGGKSNAYFAKSLDDRFIIKQVTKTELDSFEDFAPEYFKYLTESISSGSPTCLSKVLGIYQVNVKHLKGGREWKMDFMVMENLFFDRNISRVYDLKGSLRSRYNPDTSGSNKVLLDMNLLETLGTKPIFLGSKAKRRLERAVWNDTSFLASVDVMDYSLLVGIDDGRKELVIGIIDFMRQYTWDKHLETWVKASGILGGPRDESPTIISPIQYKKRFRKAMSKYFLTVPDQWSH